MKFIIKCIKLIFGVIMMLLLLGAIAVGIFCYSRWIEPNMLTVKQVSYEVPSDVEACKIVLFTDTHFGNLYPQENIEKIVAKINEQNPDIVIFAGDFVDNYVKDRDILNMEYLTSYMNAIEANYGKFAVYGNHDYGGGANQYYEEMLSQSGFQLLRNNSEFIEELNFEIRGYDDYLLGKTDNSYYKIEDDKFHMIVTHEPDVVKLITAQNQNLVLAGHSHGGQVYFPFLSEKWLPKGAKLFSRGLYTADEVGINEKTELFVSQGIGVTTIPFRFLTPPQIVVINMKPR